MKQLLLWAAGAALALVMLASCEKEEETAGNTPFIESWEWSGDTLRLSGTFGPGPGSVIVDDVPLQQGDLLGWSENTIICYIAPTAPDEIEVEVKTADKKSNRKKISRGSSGGNGQMRIDYLIVNEKTGTLQIYGQFGAQQGTVSVNNIAVPEVTVWSNPLIVCKIPQTGEGAFGEVKVSAAGKSARRTLFEWNITFECFRPQSGITGSLEEKLAAQIYIRGDRGPVPPGVFLGGNPEMFPEGYCSYRTGGTTGSSYDCGTVTADWSEVDEFITMNTGFTPWTDQTHFMARKEHRPDGFDINLSVLFYNVIQAELTITPCTGPASTTQSIRSSDIPWLDGLADLPLRFAEGSNNLRPDSLTETVSSSASLIWNAEDGHLYKHTAKIKWSSYVSDKPF